MNSTEFDKLIDNLLNPSPLTTKGSRKMMEQAADELRLLRHRLVEAYKENSRFASNIRNLDADIEHAIVANKEKATFEEKIKVADKVIETQKQAIAINKQTIERHKETVAYKDQVIELDSINYMITSNELNERIKELNTAMEAMRKVTLNMTDKIKEQDEKIIAQNEIINSQTKQSYKEVWNRETLIGMTTKIVELEKINKDLQERNDQQVKTIKMFNEEVRKGEESNENGATLLVVLSQEVVNLSNKLYGAKHELGRLHKELNDLKNDKEIEEDYQSRYEP